MRCSHRKVRADDLALDQELADSLTKVRAMIVAGEVRSGDKLIFQPSQLISPNLSLETKPRARFVSRGGIKLESILNYYEINVEGRVAADIGASTGGFTDCLLQRGASRVYAIDAGYGQLAYRLREDNRVVVMERTNARYLQQLSEKVQIVTIDVSFISLKHLLPVAASISSPDADVITLVKPQFEAPRGDVDRRGVVVDNVVRKTAVEMVYQYSLATGFFYQGLIMSPLIGPSGNEEFLMWFKKAGTTRANFEGDLKDIFNQ